MSSLIIVWEWKSNQNPWDIEHTGEWQQYPDEISQRIEEAHQNGEQTVVIDEIYSLDLRNYLQINIGNPEKQRPARRIEYAPPKPAIDTVEIVCESTLNERLSTHVTVLPYDADKKHLDAFKPLFVLGWVLKFTQGKCKVKFDKLFEALQNGLSKAGENENPSIMQEIQTDLNVVKENTKEQKKKYKIRALEDYCAKLYTNKCFIYKAVTEAMQINDRQKLDTLGPFCYLLFNYVSRVQKNSSLVSKLHQAINYSSSESMTLYRTDFISDQQKEEYEKAVAFPTRYFTWVQFISTTADQNLAETIPGNVIYVVKVNHRTIRGQIQDISLINDISSQTEYIIRPSTQFKVNEVIYNDSKQRHEITVEILPAFMLTVN